MKSRTSFCNGPLLKRMAIKGLPLWGAYLLIWLVVLPLMLYTNDSWKNTVSVQNHILSIVAGGSQISGAIYGLASACMVFHWMYKSRSANFFGALPMDRTALFGTCYLTGLLFAVVPHLISVLLSVPAALIWGAPILKELAIWFAVMTMIYLFYYSLAAAVAMVVGNLIALPVLFGIVNFTAIVVEAVVRSILEYFIYGLSFRGDFLFAWASPLYYTLLQGDGPDVTMLRDEVTHELTGCLLNGWPMILIMAALGAVFAVLAYFLFKFRRMESAGDVIAVQHLKPVVLVCFTVGCSLVIGYMLANLLLSGNIGTEKFVGVLLCMLIGGFVGYFGGQMLLQKSMRVFAKRHWCSWAVISVVIAALMLCVRFDLFGYARYVPDADEVESASLAYQDYFSDDPMFIDRVMELHQACIDRQHETERMNPEDGYTRAYLGYRLKDGSEVRREYLLPISGALAQESDSLIRMYEDTFNDPEYKVLRSIPFDYAASDIESCKIYVDQSDGRAYQEVWLTRDEAYAFLKSCLEPDLRESSMEENCWCGHHDLKYNKIYTAIDIQLTFTKQKAEETSFSRNYFFSITNDARRVLNYAAERGITP